MEEGLIRSDRTGSYAGDKSGTNSQAIWAGIFFHIAIIINFLFLFFLFYVFSGFVSSFYFYFLEKGRGKGRKNKIREKCKKKKKKPQNKTIFHDI